jgi:hypothetical protein
MAELAIQQQYIQEILTKHAQYSPPQADMETYTVFDKDGKIWIQYDGTE